MIRDETRRWLVGFAPNIGVCSIARAELWGVLDGLAVAWEHGVRKVVCEVDSKFVFDLLHEQGMIANDYFNLVWLIRDLLAKEWGVEIRHVYREGNRSTDYMATLAATLSVGVHLYEMPTQGMLDIITQDAAGICLSRLGIANS